jgi:hypothetical protein
MSNKYILDRCYITDISLLKKNKPYQIFVDSVVLVEEQGFLAKLLVYNNSLKIKGILNVIYQDINKINDIVELQMLIPEIEEVLINNEELKKKFNKLEKSFEKLEEIKF